PIVRTNPYELHIRDPDFYDELYASNQRLDKYRYGFSTVPHELHRLRRGAINPFFSVQSVTQLEPLILAKADKLCARFHALASTAEVVRINAAFIALTLYII
ncbi:hypothetical protein B0T26DRAFT_849369, partial [Lasiosphaeria miniovina]